MTDALANLMKLPEWCYGLINEQTVSIARGANHPLPVAIPQGQVDVLNARREVTIAQRLAMEAGVSLGWNSRAADPDTHSAPLGDDPRQQFIYTIVYPIQHVVTVRAYSEDEAFHRAEQEHEDGVFEIMRDGAPNIIDIQE
mgnify:CR=1 FL=1